MRFILAILATLVLCITVPAGVRAAADSVAVSAVVPETDALLTGVATYSTVEVMAAVTQADSIAVSLTVQAQPGYPRVHHPVSVALIDEQGRVAGQSRTVTNAIGIAHLDLSAFVPAGTYRIITTDENYSVPVVFTDQPEVTIVGLPGTSLTNDSVSSGGDDQGFLVLQSGYAQINEYHAESLLFGEPRRLVIPKISEVSEKLPPSG